MRKGTESTNSSMTREGRIPVWVIDDNKNFCVVLSQALNQSDKVECTACFHTCRSAIQALSSDALPPRAILLDIKMPRISGLEAISSFKRLSPSTHIIMLTSYDLDDHIRTAMKRGAEGYLLKSAVPEEIVAAIMRALNGESPLDPRINKRILDAYLGQSEENKYHLTKREKEILQKVTGGLTTMQIAEDLHLSYYTVDTHLKNIFHKLDVHNRHGLVAKIGKERLI